MISRWAVGGLLDTATALDLVSETLRLTGSTPTWLVREQALQAWQQLPDFAARAAVGTLGPALVYANPTHLTEVFCRRAGDARAHINATLGAVFDPEAGNAWAELLLRGACVLCLPVPNSQIERTMGSSLLRRVPGTVRIYDVASPPRS